jgi:putative copper resistance protein D
MLASFAIEGGLPLVLARGVAVAGLFSVFGSVLARAAVMRPVLAQLGPGTVQLVERRWRRLVWTSCVVAAVALGTWAWLVAGTFADTPGLAATAATVPVLLHETVFGHIVLLQVGALVLVALAMARRLWWLAAVLAASAVAFEAGHGHAAAGPSFLLLSSVLHLLAGAAWLGSLLPLLLVVAIAPVDSAALVCRRFSPFGTACVVTLICTAGFQFWALIGSLPGMTGTAYGVLALVKILLFAAMLGFAARHRFRLTSALSGDTPQVARRRLRRSIAGETMVGLLLVLAAGVLSSLPPAMHAHSAGMAMRSTRNIPASLQAPDLQAECGGNRTLTSADLHGQILRLVIGIPRRPPATENGVTTGWNDPGRPAQAVAAIHAHPVTGGVCGHTHAEM